MLQFRTGEFAKKAGVTTRTLRYYDRLGLLKPTRVSDSGQRIYTETDFAKLQQILTLKLIGLPLNQINNLLTTNTAEVKILLTRQVNVLKQKEQQLKSLIENIEKAQQYLQTTNKLDVQHFVSIIQDITMSNKYNWFNQFYTDEQRQKLAERSKDFTLEDQKKVAKDWENLYTDAKALMHRDVTDPQVQKLVDRWEGLIHQFTQGDPGITASLSNAYQNIDKAPQDVQDWAKGYQEISAFIMKAKAVRNK